MSAATPAIPTRAVRPAPAGASPARRALAVALGAPGVLLALLAMVAPMPPAARVVTGAAACLLLVCARAAQG